MKTLHPRASTSARPDSRQARLQEDTRFHVLQALQNRPEISQRELSRELGVSLGAINYSLRALIHKGLIKIDNFQNSRHKLGYVYILTPEGLIEKSRMAKRFLERKFIEYENIKRQIEILSRKGVK